MNAKLLTCLLIAVVGGAAVMVLRSKRSAVVEAQVATSTTAPPPAVPPPNLDGLPHDERSPATRDAPKSLDSKVAAPASHPKQDVQSDWARFIEESDRKWKAKYEGLSVAELESALDAIETSLNEQANPLLTEMLKAGQSTLVSTDGQRGPTLTSSDNEDLSMFQMQRGVGTFRATLSREEYPDLYELKRECKWLYTVAIARQTAAESPAGK